MTISQVWVNEAPYTEFDAAALTVTLPPERGVTVRVRLVPTSTEFRRTGRGLRQCRDHHRRGVVFEDANVRLFERELEKLAEHNVTRLTIEAAGLTAVSTGAIRALLMQRQRLELGDQQDVVLNGLCADVKAAVLAVDPDHAGLPAHLSSPVLTT